MAIMEERRETSPVEIKTYEKAAKVITGGAVGEGFGGAATIVLTILGLAHLFPALMSQIATIVIGAALLWEGALVSSQYSRLETGFGSNVRMGSGAGIQAFGGAAGCVLGILSLLGVYPGAFISIAAIIYGVVLAASSVANYAVDVNVPWRDGKTLSVSPVGSTGAAGLQMMAGFAAGILGILALVGTTGVAVVTFNLIAMLSAGAAILFSGTAVSARIFRSF